MLDLKNQLQAWKTDQKADLKRARQATKAAPASNERAELLGGTPKKHNREPIQEKAEQPKELSPKDRALFMEAVDGPLDGGAILAQTDPAAGQLTKAQKKAAPPNDQALFMAAMERMDAPHGGDEETSPANAPPKNAQVADARLVRQVMRRERKPDATLDLHGDNVADAATRFLQFLNVSQERGQRLVLVVHGHGQGILSKEVETWAGSDERVAFHFVAPSHLGSSGARVIYLRKKGK